MPYDMSGDYSVVCKVRSGRREGVESGVISASASHANITCCAVTPDHEIDQLELTAPLDTFRIPQIWRLIWGTILPYPECFDTPHYQGESHNKIPNCHCSNPDTFHPKIDGHSVLLSRAVKTYISIPRLIRYPSQQHSYLRQVLSR